MFISVPNSARRNASLALSKVKSQSLIFSSLKLSLDPYGVAQLLTSQAYINNEQAVMIIDLAKTSTTDKDLLGGTAFIKYLKEQIKY